MAKKSKALKVTDDRDVIVNNIIVPADPVESILRGAASEADVFKRLELGPEAGRKAARKRLLELAGKKGVRGPTKKKADLTEAERTERKARRAAKSKAKREDRNAYLRSQDPTGVLGIAPRYKAPKGSKSEEQRKAERAARGVTKRQQSKDLKAFAKEHEAELRKLGLNIKL